MTKQKPRYRRKKASPWKILVTGLLADVALVVTLVLLIWLLPHLGAGSQKRVSISVPDVPRRFDTYLEDQGELLSTAVFSPVQAGVEPSTRPVRRLNDDDLVAPKPDPEKYGTAQTAQELIWFPAAAGSLLNGQSLYFGAARDLKPGAPIQYYLDDTIAVVTWKEVERNSVLTFAEVVIADGSQFRRFLAGGQFGADTQFKTTEMAQSVNAVLASSGDFYKFRYNGVVVYGGQVRRVNTNKADTCYIDADGNLLFTYQNTVMTQEEAQKFVDDNRIRFSLTFGPVLVDNGQRCEPSHYDLGEVDSYSPRAALCQLGELHYLVITANPEDGFPGRLNIHQFAERIEQIGCRKAYTLDGGQTAAIALDGELVNHVLYGQQRPISDIIYFATAIPEGG